MNFDYDLLIVGGGLVGASLACALADGPVRIGLVEPVPPVADSQPSYDDRTTALAPTTRAVFEATGIWPELRGHTTPIREIHVSDQGRFGFARMHAEEFRMEALGYVVSNRQLGDVLPARAAAAPNCDFLCPARLAEFEIDPTGVVARIEHGEQALVKKARLLVVADGARSTTRERLGVGIKLVDYGQVAIVTNLTPERSHQGRAYERFTRGGPMALLPAEAGRCALIWTVPANEADELLALDDDAFLARVQQLFGYRLGRFLKVGKRARYPLVSMNAERYTVPRAVVIGNAAHTLHPVAGQGFNLALRDVATLAELVHDAVERGEDPGRAALLDRYEQLRRGDYRRTAGFTDALIRLFSNALPGLVGARNLGLLGFDLLPLAKPLFVRQAMGKGGRLPRLARGLPLALQEERA